MTNPPLRGMGRTAPLARQSTILETRKTVKSGADLISPKEKANGIDAKVTVSIGNAVMQSTEEGKDSDASDQDTESDKEMQSDSSSDLEKDLDLAAKELDALDEQLREQPNQQLREQSGSSMASARQSRTNDSIQWDNLLNQIKEAAGEVEKDVAEMQKEDTNSANANGDTSITTIDGDNLNMSKTESVKAEPADANGSIPTFLKKDVADESMIGVPTREDPTVTSEDSTPEHGAFRGSKIGVPPVEDSTLGDSTTGDSDSAPVANFLEHSAAPHLAAKALTTANTANTAAATVGSHSGAAGGDMAKATEKLNKPDPIVEQVLENKSGEVKKSEEVLKKASEGALKKEGSSGVVLKSVYGEGKKEGDKKEGEKKDGDQKETDKKEEKKPEISYDCSKGSLFGCDSGYLFALAENLQKGEKFPSDTQQRHQLLHTRDTLAGKVASDIVEAGVVCKEKNEVDVQGVKKTDASDPVKMSCGILPPAETCTIGRYVCHGKHGNSEFSLMQPMIRRSALYGKQMNADIRDVGLFHGSTKDVLPNFSETNLNVLISCGDIGIVRFTDPATKSTEECMLASDLQTASDAIMLVFIVTSPEAINQAKRIEAAKEARRRANNYRDIAVAPTGYRLDGRARGLPPSEGTSSGTGFFDEDPGGVGGLGSAGSGSGAAAAASSAGGGGGNGGVFQGGAFHLESPCDNPHSVDLSVMEQGQAVTPPDLMNMNFNQNSSSIMDDISPVNGGGMRARSAHDDDNTVGSSGPAGKQVWSGGSGGGALLSDDE